jgi:uncharacterized alkaline shock family protein YloU
VSTAISSLALARTAAAAALATPGVVRLSGGSVGEFSTYGPRGERVTGVRARWGHQPALTLRLVVELGRPIPELVRDVRRRVQSAVIDATGMRIPVDLEVVDVAGDRGRRTTRAATGPDVMPASARAGRQGKAG